MDRVTLTTRVRLPRFHSCVRPIRGNEAIFRPAAATPECEAPRARIQSKANLQCSRQGSRRTGAAAKAHGAGLILSYNEKLPQATVLLRASIAPVRRMVHSKVR